MDLNFFYKSAQDFKRVLHDLEQQIGTLTRTQVLEQLASINHFVVNYEGRFPAPQKLAEYVKKMVTPYISGPDEPDHEILEKLFLINQALLKKTNFRGDAAKVQFRAFQTSLASELLPNRVLKLYFSRRLAESISAELGAVSVPTTSFASEHCAATTSSAASSKSAAILPTVSAAFRAKRVIFISETHIRDPEVFEAVKILFSSDPANCVLCFDSETVVDLCQKDPTIMSIDIVGHAPM